MPIARSTYAGVATGAVLLAGAVGFGVGLPKVVEDSSYSAGDLPALPDKIDDRFVALSTVTAEQAGATGDQASQFETVAENAAEGDAKASSNLSSIYDAAVTRSYIDVKALGQIAQTQARPAQFAITVVPGDAGLVMPSGPFQIEQQGTHYELKEVDGRRCSVIYSDAIDPTTGAPTGEEPPAAGYQVECRAEQDGLTYDIYGSGLTPDEVLHYLDLVLEG
ncbi:hypothetical protein [Nocardioides sp. J54]|uniref:hypothetical protein n=1 Tax=Nocardioides sp. J54 TaxID=935866 RepID=UPI00048B1341|nr:hypothetical protein [Nocardioides sp. J54]